MTDRAVSPVVGIALLVVIVVLLATALGVVANRLVERPGEPPQVAVRAVDRTTGDCVYTFAAVRGSAGGLVYYERAGDRVIFDDDGDGVTEAGEGRRLPPRGEVTLLAERDDRTYVVGDYTGTPGTACLARTSTLKPGATAEHGFRYDVRYFGGSGTVGNSLNEVTVTYESGSGVDASGVTTADVTGVGFDRDGDTAIDVSVVPDLQSVSVSNGGRTIALQFVGNYDVKRGDELLLGLAAVGNPTAPGRYNVTVDVNGDVSQQGTIVVR